MIVRNNMSRDIPAVECTLSNLMNYTCF
uniref:Uncharacterized protein n=1 Tax=Amphimedon queenslandica TaxID=400682 RepID=A0A1X7SUE3_AMPQE